MIVSRKAGQEETGRTRRTSELFSSTYHSYIAPPALKFANALNNPP